MFLKNNSNLHDFVNKRPMNLRSVQLWTKLKHKTENESWEASCIKMISGDTLIERDNLKNVNFLHERTEL